MSTLRSAFFSKEAEGFLTSVLHLQAATRLIKTAGPAEKQIIRLLKGHVRNRPQRYLGLATRRQSQPEYIGQLMNQFMREQGGIGRGLSARYPRAIRMGEGSRRDLANLLSGADVDRRIAGRKLTDENLSVALTNYLKGGGPDPFMKGTLITPLFGNWGGVYEFGSRAGRRLLNR